jgi:hypothetical protein
MRIFILGTGKSGTTALVYKVAGGLPNCQAFSGGKPGKYLNNYENAVYKHTYEESKGKSFELYLDHLNKEHYDRKIWMARDPRDVAVSRMLYRWQRGSQRQKEQYRAHLDLVLEKEKDPRSISFSEIYRYARFNQWPISLEAVYEEEKVRYQRMFEFVKCLEDDWFFFTYENMVDKNFDALNSYLGFDVVKDAEVPQSTGKAKVIRKKATGDWRHWFTTVDVALLKPAYTPYMEHIGYDCEDWECSPEPIIEPEYSSKYMQKLAQRPHQNVVSKTMNAVRQRLFG